MNPLIFLFCLFLPTLSYGSEGKIIELPEWETTFLFDQTTKIIDRRKDSFIENLQNSQEFGITQSVRLPQVRIEDPVLYVTQLDQFFQAFLDDRLFYQTPGFADGKSEFHGISWVLIDLPPDFAGKKLTLRIFSNYKTIGVQGIPLLAAKADLYRKSITSALEFKFSSALHLVLGILLIFVVFCGLRNLGIVGLAFYSLFLSIYFFCSTFESQLILGNAFLHMNLFFYSLIFVFPCFAFCLSRFTSAKSRRLLQFFMSIDFTFAVVQIVGQMLNLIKPWETFGHYLLLNSGLIGCVGLVIVYEAFWLKSRTFKVLSLATLFLLGGAFFDNMVSLGIVNLNTSVSPYTTIFMTFSMTYWMIANELETKKRLALTQENFERLKAESLVQKHESVTHLTCGIAHEFNNPLAIIQQSISLIKDVFKDKASDPTFIKLFEMMTKAGHRIHALNDSLLELSVNPARNELHKVSLQDLLFQIVKEVDIKGIQLDIPTGENFGVLMYKDYIKKAIVHLLKNAADACKEKGNQGHIGVKLIKLATHIEIRVEDNGSGIDEKDEQRIFDPFYSTKEIGLAKGMGLFLSLHYLRMNGGDLQLRSRCNPTAFVISLP